MPRKVGVLAWLNVVLVGALVLGIVFVMHLYPRLDAGQKVVNGLKPAFTPARAQGDVTGITFVGHLVNLADPITTPQGTAAGEVPALVSLVSSKTGLAPAAVLSTLATNYPNVLALLEAIPLSSVSAELPGFEAFVAKELKVTVPQLVTTLQTSFPHLYQALANLPVVTSGWDNLPSAGVKGLTQFNGAAVTTAPELQQYFSQDVVPVVGDNVSNYHRVATYFPPVNDIPILLTVIGAIAVLFGLLMMLRASTTEVGAKEGRLTWGIVLLLGIIVLAIVFGFQVYPRLDGGSHLLRDAAPAYTTTRVAGDVTGIAYDSHVVDLSDAIMNPQGGASTDIANLVAALEKKTGLTETQLVAAIVNAGFPHTAALLVALPLSTVNTQLTSLEDFLATKLGISNDQLVAALEQAVPGIAQSIVNLPAVVNGWDTSPGGTGLTRFDGTPVLTAPQLRDYFAMDVIPAVANTADNFSKLNVHPDLTLFPGLLTILGGLVVIYGIIMLLVVAVLDQGIAPQGAARRAPSVGRSTPAGRSGEPAAKAKAAKTKAPSRRGPKTDFS